MDLTFNMMESSFASELDKVKQTYSSQSPGWVEPVQVQEESCEDKSQEEADTKEMVEKKIKKRELKQVIKQAKNKTDDSDKQALWKVE